jgi:hypothetical protein
MRIACGNVENLMARDSKQARVCGYVEKMIKLIALKYDKTVKQ